MCLPINFISPQSPLRPPGWRWLRAGYLVDNGRRLSRCRDDNKVWDAVAFYRALRSCQDERGRARLARKMPAFFEAWQVYQQASLVRWEVEARLLANEETEAIARKCGLSANAVEVFHDTFFSVRPHLRARDWIMNCVIGPKVHRGLKETDQDELLKLYAFAGGPLVVDSLMDYFRHPVPNPAVPDADGLAQLQLHQSIRRSIRMRTLPANAVHFPGLTVLLALLDRKQPAGCPGPHDLIDHFLADSNPVSLLKFATAAGPVPCKRPA